MNWLWMVVVVLTLGQALMIYQFWRLVQAHNHLVEAYVARTPPPEYVAQAYKLEAMKQRSRWKP